jgi:AcrR family transcriptional regulator
LVDVYLFGADSMSKPAGRRERKRQQTMDHLADTAWELFEAQGYEAVTMEAIAEAADVAKGTLYKYFPVKETLLRHHFHRELAEGFPEVLAQLSSLPTATAQLRGFLEMSADWSIRNRQHLGPYLHLRMSETSVPYDLNSPNRSGMEQVFLGFIRNGQESGEFRSDIESAVATHYLEFLYLGALMRWLNGMATDLHEEFDTMLDFGLRGLQA